MTNEQFEQIERLSKKLWGDINNGHEYSMVTYSEFLGIVTEVWERLQEEPVSEDFEKALAKEWKGYIDRGAATVDALEDNTQELAFAKGFYRGAQWDKNQAMAEIQSQSMALAHGCPKEESVSEDLEEASVEWFNSVKYKSDLSGTPISAFKAGAKWMAEQGVTKEAVIGMATEEIAINISQPTLDALDLCAGDKVIIQIRK